MYKINLHHKLPKKSEINPKFFFNEYKIRKEFFLDPIFLSLPDVKEFFKVKNEKDSYKNKNIICIRKSTKLNRNYTLPSIFIDIKDIKKCQSLIYTFLEENVYNKVLKKDERKIIEILDYLKEKEIHGNKIKIIVIDFIVNYKNIYPIELKLFHKLLIDNNHNLEEKNYKEITQLLIARYSDLYCIENKEKIKEKTERNKQKKEKLNKEKEQLELILRAEKSKKDEVKKELISTKIKTFNALLKDKIKNLDNIITDEVLKIVENKINTTYFSWLNENTNSEANIDMNKYLSELFRLDPKKISDMVDNDIKIKEIFKVDFQIGYNKTRKHNVSQFKESIYRAIDKTKEKELFYYETVPFSFLNKKVNLEVIFDKSKIEKDDFYKYIEELNSININKYMERKLLIILTSYIGFNEKKEKDLLEYVQHKNGSRVTEKSKVYNINNVEDILNKIVDILSSRCDFNNITKKFITENTEMLSIYKNIFKKARNREREITYFAGVTNSGKTYSAFEEIKNYKKGIYLAPLRLLAIEGQEEINKRGYECSLMTGEERDIVPTATFMSSTIEMLNVDEEYDVAIIDEIQMIDSDRGAAWLQALVGVNAKKVIIVGSNEVKTPIENILKYLNEPLEYKEFKRKSKLSLGKLSNMDKKLEPNSAVIAFSKKELYSLKAHFEGLGNKVSIIYGKLPPSVKISESEKFRTGENDVLVSTDAIGMGLNLPIKKIYFYNTEKFDGEAVDSLDPSLVKQIAGRAGRFGMFEEGIVSAFSKSDLSYIKECLESNTEVETLYNKTTITLTIFEELLKINKERNLEEIMKLYHDLEFDIATCEIKEQYLWITHLIENKLYYLSNREIVKLLNAPINTDKNDTYKKFFTLMVNKIYDFRKKEKNTLLFSNEKELKKFYLGQTVELELEEKYKILDILHFFMFSFYEFENCEEFILKQKEDVSEHIKKLIKLKKY